MPQAHITVGVSFSQRLFRKTLHSDIRQDTLNTLRNSSSAIIIFYHKKRINQHVQIRRGNNR